jgi:hypothetical protein
MMARLWRLAAQVARVRMNSPMGDLCRQLVDRLLHLVALALLSSVLEHELHELPIAEIAGARRTMCHESCYQLPSLLEA